MEDIECPFCLKEFEAKTYHNDVCPQCGNEYSWDEQCAEDYSDCWTILLWEKY